jgi:hypothetical protein
VKKVLIGLLIVVVVLAGGALAAVPLIEREVAGRIKADMARDGKQADAVEVGLFDRRITLTNLRGKDNAEITIAHWEASGIAWPLDELIRGRTPASGLKLGDPLQAKRLEMRGFRLTEHGVDWSIGSLSIEDFDLARYDPQLSGPGRFGSLAARIGAALTMGRLDQKDTVISDSDGGRGSIASLAVRNYDKGLVGSIVIAGISMSPKASKDPAFTLADFNLTRLDLRRAFRAIGVPAWRPGMPIGRVELGAGSLSGFGGEAMAHYGMSLGRITSESRTEADNVKHSRMRIEGFALAPPPRGIETLQMRIVLQAMGLKELRLDFDCSGSEDRGKSEVTVEHCVLKGPELGEIDFSTRLVGADAEFWRAVDEGDNAALLRTKAGLSAAKLVVVDRGLVERSLKAIATTSGQPLAAVRAGIAQQIRRYQPPDVLITEDMTKLLDTVARFIETGGTLAIEASPDAPLGIDKLAYFMQPGPDLVRLLGLKATLTK